MVTFPHGETNITLACQNRCASCNHFIPMQAPWYIKTADLRRDLEAAAKVMHFEVYNLVGGEPTLHPAIVDLLQIVKESGICDRREITTNGQACECWPNEFYQNIDDLIVTPYKLTQYQRELIEAKCFLFGVRLEWHIVQFTYAASRGPHAPGRAEDLYRDCWYNVNRHAIDGGHFYRCCISPFIPSILLHLPKEYDAIPLEGLTEQALVDYMAQAETPTSCTRCLSNMGNLLPWHETTRENWMEESLQ